MGARSTFGTFVRSFVAACLIGAPALVLAAVHQFTVLVDRDANPATGCTVATAAGPFAGAELALVTEVTTTAANAAVTRIDKRTCNGGSFGAPQNLETGSWPVGLGAGVSGVAVIETSLALAGLGGVPNEVRLAVTSRNALGNEDALIGAAPVTLAVPATLPPRQIPLAPTLVWLLAIALGIAAAAVLRRHGHSRLVVALAWLLLAPLVLALAMVVRDGQIGDWQGVSPFAAKSKGAA